MKRRRLLIAAALLLATAAVARLVRVFARAPRTRTSVRPPIAATDRRALLLALADAIVPRDGEWPAASETGLAPHLERWIASSGERRQAYERYFPLLEAELQRTVPFVGGRPDPERLAERLQRWHLEYRSGDRSPAVVFFEQLRRDVLRVYYASPAGWARVGYAGPVRRAHPREAGPQ